MGTLTTNPTATLGFGSLRFHGAGADMQDDGFTLEVSDDGVTFGSSEAVVEVARRLWADGSEVSQDGADNAETAFFLRIGGGSLLAMARGEAAVRREFPGDGETTPLVWRPAHDAPAGVRTVLHASMKLEWDGYAEAGLIARRVYRISVTHAPFVASEFETVVPSLPTTGVPVVATVDAFTSASAWSMSTVQSTTRSVTVAGGVLTAVATSTSGALSTFTWTLTRAGSVDFTGTPYAVVEYRHTGMPIQSGADPLLMSGGETFPVLSRTRLPDGWTRAIYQVEGVRTSLTLHNTTRFPMPPGSSSVNLEVRRFDRSSTPVFGSRQALTRTLDIGGTERTQGALRISGSGAPFPLGTVIVHTSPDLGDGYTPELMDGTLEYTTRTAGDNAPAGYWYANAVATTVPSARFHEGSYAPVVWLSSANTQTVMVQIIITSTASTASALYYAETLRTHVTFAAGEVKAVRMRLATLPGVRSRVGAVKFAVSVPGAVADSMKIGGLWAYRSGRDCALSIFTTDQPYAWLTPETLVSTQRITVSDVDSIDAGWDPGANAIQSPESHILPAGRVLNHVVTGRVQDADVSYRYTKKWPFNPGDDGSKP